MTHHRILLSFKIIKLNDFTDALPGANMGQNHMRADIPHMSAMGRYSALILFNKPPIGVLVFLVQLLICPATPLV